MSWSTYQQAIFDFVANADGYPIAMYTGAMSVSALDRFIRGAIKGAAS